MHGIIEKSSRHLSIYILTVPPNLAKQNPTAIATLQSSNWLLPFPPYTEREREREVLPKERSIYIYVKGELYSQKWHDAITNLMSCSKGGTPLNRCLSPRMKT